MTSIRLTIFLLLILAVVAVVGTVAAPDIYYRLWFLVPLGLLALNLLACLVEGLPQALRKAARPFTGEMALLMPERGRFIWPADAAAPALAQEALGREVGRPRHEIIGEKEVFFYGRGRFRPLGPYLVHLSLVLILVGGVVGKFWGVEGRMLLQPGLDVSSMELNNPRKTLPLAFQVRLDRFQIFSYKEGGTPKEFRSDLRFFQDGQEKARVVCRVNEPVTFGDYTFYQSSYGTMPQKSIPLKASQGEKSWTLELPLRRWVDLPEGQGRIMAVRVEANLQGHGPGVQLGYRSGSEHPQVFWLLEKHPEMAAPLGSLRLALGPMAMQYYSVLQVKHDPGVWWVYGGFLLLLIGLYLAFLRPSQRWAVVLERGKKGRWDGRLLGASPRGRETFVIHTERLLERLQKGAS
ncbi:MAG: cytochrome c biogenesis protein ResB [Thermodesulfobacteriota bacterium]